MGILNKLREKPLTNSYIIKKLIGVRSMEKCIECGKDTVSYLWSGHLCEDCLTEYLNAHYEEKKDEQTS